MPRRLLLSMMRSIDGYVAGPNGDIGWHVWEDEMSEYMMGVFDEYQLIVTPVVLGKGTPLFAGEGAQPQIALVDTQRFAGGNVILTYKPRT